MLNFLPAGEEVEGDLPPNGEGQVQGLELFFHRRHHRLADALFLLGGMGGMSSQCMHEIAGALFLLGGMGVG